jgi:hypothetical protein
MGGQTVADEGLPHADEDERQDGQDARAADGQHAGQIDQYEQRYA